MTSNNVLLNLEKVGFYRVEGAVSCYSNGSYQLIIDFFPWDAFYEFDFWHVNRPNQRVDMFDLIGVIDRSRMEWFRTKNPKPCFQILESFAISCLSEVVNPRLAIWTEQNWAELALRAIERRGARRTDHNKYFSGFLGL